LAANIDSRLRSENLKERVYRSATKNETLLELELFSETCDNKYPQTAESWQTYWQYQDLVKFTE